MAAHPAASNNLSLFRMFGAFGSVNFSKLASASFDRFFAHNTTCPSSFWIKAITSFLVWLHLIYL